MPPCMYVSDGCTSGKVQAYAKSACLPCKKAGRPAGPGNGLLKAKQDREKASGKHNLINTPIFNAQKKAKRETAYLKEAKAQLGAALDPVLNDEQAQELVQTFVYTDSMVACFIKASTTDSDSPISGCFSFTSRPNIDNEAIRFLWAHNSTPVVQPIDPDDARASKTTGYLTEANASQLATWTPALYQTDNRFNIKKVEYWAQQALEYLPLGVKLWRVPGAGGGEDKRADVGKKTYKLFFTQLNSTPEALRLKVVD